MNTEDSCLLCGIKGLQSQVGSAVTIALDFTLNGHFNNRLEEGAILQVNVSLDGFFQKGGAGCAVTEACLFGEALNLGLDRPGDLRGKGDKRLRCATC